jgi:DnaJ family protein B protein 4
MTTSNNNNYYDILEIQKNATDEEIKKAYRKLSLLYHPDRNSTPESHEKMQEINQAYQTLSNKESKQQYDMQMNGFTPNPFSFAFTGGNDMNMNAHFAEGGGIPMEFADMNNIFNMMFGKNGHDMGQHIFQQLNKPPPIVSNIYLTLEQSYNGCTYPVEIEKWVLINNIREMKKEALHVNVPPGIDKNEIIILRDCGNSINGNINGDIKIMVNIANDSIFERNGMDLLMKKTISLKEALCGFTFQFKHINGSSFAMKHTSVICPNQSQIIAKLGMKKDNHIGNLIVSFEITFPTTLENDKIEILKTILPN